MNQAVAQPPTVSETAPLELESHPILSQQSSLTAIAITLSILLAAYGGVLSLQNSSRLLVEKLQFMPVFGVASIVILIGMFGLYVYGYRFYKDVFYLFVGTAWFANAIYIAFETFFDPSENVFRHGLDIDLFALASFLPFYVASFTDPEHPMNYRRLLTTLSLWFFWIAASMLLGQWLVQSRWPGIKPGEKFIIHTWGGIPFAFWTLIRVGNSVKLRLREEVHGRWAQIFPATFFAYAGLQFLYLLRLYPDVTRWMRASFVIALAVKIANSVSAISVIQSDFVHLREQLHQRSVLEDIGALASGIEHDVKNPLQVINNLILVMRQKFQAEPEVLRQLQRLEEQTRRIYAATEIVPALRGGREFYEQFMVKTSVGDLVRRSINAVKVEMAPSGIEFYNRASQDEVPSKRQSRDRRITGRPLYVRAYAPMLQQAIVNVLRNAVEAIRQAERKDGAITVMLKELGGPAPFVVILVQDNGIGIPKEDISRVTELFTTKRDLKPNSGIGLFISDRIMKLHHGRLAFDSEVGLGTTVSLIVPMWEEPRVGGTAGE